MREDTLSECPECGRWTQEGAGCRCADCQEKAANRLACFNTSPELFRNARDSYKRRGIFLVIADAHVVAGSDGIVARFEDDAAAMKCLEDAGYSKETGLQNTIYKP